MTLTIEAEEDTTGLLRLWGRGCEGAADRVLARLYPELAKLVTARVAGWSLPAAPSDVLQEVALRMAGQERTSWQDRRHFFAVAARVIRRVMMDEARRCRSQKRGGAEEHLPLVEELVGKRTKPAQLLDLDRALEGLTEIDPTAAQVVELRYFAGLSVSETAAVLGVSVATAVRRWRFARAWLFTRLGGVGGDES